MVMGVNGGWPVPSALVPSFPAPSTLLPAWLGGKEKPVGSAEEKNQLRLDDPDPYIGSVFTMLLSPHSRCNCSQGAGLGSDVISYFDKVCELPWVIKAMMDQAPTWMGTSASDLDRPEANHHNPSDYDSTP